MRWFWIDRFETFEVGQRAETVKNVTLAEEPLDDYAPGEPHYPASLMIEGMAQTGGLLISQMEDFTQRVVLAKVSKAEFFELARPGDQLRLIAVLLAKKDDGAIVDGTILCQGRTIAKMELTFAILDETFGQESFFNPGDLCRILRSLRLFDVARNSDGSPVSVPQYMLEADLAEEPVIFNPRP
jgi:3-hydroxyacyl-[acyl-carrier-protein] dehydratase